MPGMTNQLCAERLKKAGIRPSSVRIHVLRYLDDHHTHPTVDQIYQALRGALPTLSRASVYNTVSTLETAGLVRQLGMDTITAHYDAHTEDHGHFRCQHCGVIFDFDLPDLACNDLEGFVVEKRDVLMWGICPDCVLSHDTP
jgi:Fur family peroxide stress response transcriptional regulator